MTLLANSSTVIDTNYDAFFNRIEYTSQYFKIKLSFVGSTYGFAYGGQFYSPVSFTSLVERFPFNSSSIGTSSIGNLTTARGFLAGQSAADYAYASGGQTTSTGTYTDIIDKFSMISEAISSVSVGTMISRRSGVTGQSSSNFGYISGGQLTPYVNTIERFPFFDTTVNAATVGALTVARSFSSSQSSNTHGYNSGGLGLPNATILNTIDRFPFASATVDASSVGSLIVSRYTCTGQSSETTGYASGGFELNPTWIVPSFQIESFPFASSSTNATDVGDLFAAKSESASCSSRDYAYTMGGRTDLTTTTTTIERFPTSSTLSSTSVGALSISKYGITGHQI